MVSVVYITLTGNSKILSLLSPPRRSDLASLATEERHSPNPVFDPPKGETHRHRGAETRRCSPRQTCQSPVWAFLRFSGNSNSKQKIPSCLPTVVVPLFLPSSQDLSRFFLRPSNSRDGRGNPAFRSGKPHVTAASQRTAKGRRPLQQIRKYCHLWQHQITFMTFTCPNVAFNPPTLFIYRLWLIRDTRMSIRQVKVSQNSDFQLGVFVP